VDVARLSSPESMAARFRLGTGIVQFLCEDAVRLGFTAFWENDEGDTSNAAHAHVYLNGVSKAARQALAQKCLTVIEPAFDLS
jgi:hypothetical protein